MFGLIPTHPLHLLALLVPLVIWLYGRKLAKTRHVTVIHNASFAVSYWEEVLFRGVLWGLIVWLTGNIWLALVGSSVLFGLFHLRNAWWASPKQLLQQCLYTGLLFAPFIGLVQLWTGDIYTGIALHAIHNFVSMYYPNSLKVPKDDYLLSRRNKRNWFERLLS